MTLFVGDFSQSEKLSAIEPSLVGITNYNCFDKFHCPKKEVVNKGLNNPILDVSKREGGLLTGKIFVHTNNLGLFSHPQKSKQGLRTTLF